MSRLAKDLMVVNIETKEVVAVYSSFVDCCGGKLLAAELNLYPANKNNFHASAALVAKKMLADFKGVLTKATRSVADLALSENLGDTKLSIADTTILNGYLEEVVNCVLVYTESMSVMDIKGGCDQLRKKALCVILTDGAKQPVLTIDTEKNRKTEARVGLMVRQHLIAIFNEVTMFVGVKQGCASFVIKTHSSKGGFNDAKIEIGDYEGIRQKAFHPNSNALIYKISHQ